MKKTKVDPLINNGDLKLPNGSYSKNHKNVFKNISVFRPHQKAKISKFGHFSNTSALLRVLSNFLSNHCL